MSRTRSQALHRASPGEQRRRRRARWLKNWLGVALTTGVVLSVLATTWLVSDSRDHALARELEASGAHGTARDARVLIDAGGRGGPQLDRVEAVVATPGREEGVVARLRFVELATTGLSRGWHDAPADSAYVGEFDVVASLGAEPVAMETGDLERALTGNDVAVSRTVLVIVACWTIAWALVAWAVVRDRSRGSSGGQGVAPAAGSRQRVTSR
jgi:hypothetical protein